MKLGTSEEYVSHRILLLDLPSNILGRLQRNEISASQAQELVWFKDETTRNAVFERMEKEKLSVAAIRQVRKELEAESPDEDNRTRSEADFEIGRVSQQEKSVKAKSREKRIIEEAILGLRVALVRLDSAVSKSEAREIRDLLMKERYALHDQIDRLIRVKTRMPD